MSSTEFLESKESIYCTSMSMSTSIDTSGNTIYNGIAATNGGIWYTSDGGVTWTLSQSTCGFDFYTVFMVNNCAIASVTGGGGWYSTNYGETWIPSNVTDVDFSSIYMVTSIDTSGNPVYNATAGSDNSNGGAYFSSDGGETWTQSTITDASGDAISDSIVSVFMAGPNAIAASNEDGGIYYSSNYGAAWIKSETLSTTIVYATFMVESTNASGNLVYNAIAGTNNTGLWYSTDAGVTWSQSNIISGGFNGNEVYMVASTDTSGNPAYDASGNPVYNAIAGSNENYGLYYSSDSGVTWTQSNITTGYPAPVYMVGTNAIALIAGDDAPVYYSTNYGVTWTQSTDSSGNLSGNFLAVSMVETNAILGGVNTTGLWYSSNSGNDWTRTENILGVSVIYSNGNGYGIALLTNTNGLCYTTDGGQSWSTTCTSSSEFVSGFIDSSGNSVVGTTSLEIYYSINGGATWNRSTITDASGDAISDSIVSVFMAGPNAIAASTTSKYISSKSISATLASYFKLFILLGNNGLAASPNGIFFTQDIGKSWFQSSQTAGYDFSSVAMNDNGIALAASSSGIWSSQNFGKLWNQLPNTTGIDFTLVAMSGNFGIAASKLHGLWYLCLTNNVLSIVQSNIESGNFASIAISGRKAVAGGDEGVLYSLTGGKIWLKSNLSLNTVAVSISRSTVVACVSGYGAYSSSNAGKTFTLTNLTNGTVNSVSVVDSNVIVGSETGIYYSVNIPCFKEDTKILTDKGYVPIQDLKKGDLIKTLNNDYKPIDMIGKRTIHHPASQERIKDQLYQCSQTEYPEVFEPLIITGRHSILVDNFTGEEQKKKVIEVNGDIYVTDEKYRLPACADLRTFIYEKQGFYTIYHLALESDNYNMNYGIYANGLVVETCSKHNFEFQKWN